MIFFTFGLEGADALGRRYETIRRKIVKPGQFARKYLAPLIRELFEKRFNSEGRSGGGSWKRLTPRYAAYKALTFPGRKTLERTGQMRRSFTEARNRYHVSRFRNGRIEVGSKLERAAWHQFGTSRMAARPILPTKVPKYFIEDARNLLRQYMLGDLT